MPARNQYIIIRDDLPVDPVPIISEGLLIGRLLRCDLMLNHPSVSRVQAGIKQVDDNYYLFSLRPKNPVILNGRPVEENEALAAGDIIEVGPYQLQIDSTEDELVIRVEGGIGTKLKPRSRARLRYRVTKRSTFSGTSEFVRSGRWRGRHHFIRRAAGAAVR